MKALLALMLLSMAAPWSAAQTTASIRQDAERSIEDLNLVGGSATMPRFGDSLLGTESGLRRALYAKGIVIRANVLPRFSVNVLDPPVAASEQVYIGQRPTWITGVNPILTADLRQLHLHDAQLNLGGAWRWTNWNPAGPKTVALSTLYLYKGWLGRRVEAKAGYVTNDTEFVGIQVGGSLATGAQGVYAVLPFQVGMSYFPLTAPSLNLRVRSTRGAYVKAGAQRSLDAAGGIATEARNPSGFRFAPAGNGLLLIGELGYQRAASASARQAWLRGGYLHNDTLYKSRITGLPESGNYCAYLLADYQLRPSGPAGAGRGLYVGVTAMVAPSEFNAYDRYYEARLYQRAPFGSRPDDLLSFVAAYRGHSRYVTGSLEAQGRTVWRSSPSVAASYSVHLARGNYATLGATYVRGPAITPRVPDTLTLTATWGLYL